MTTEKKFDPVYVSKFEIEGAKNAKKIVQRAKNRSYHLDALFKKDPRRVELMRIIEEAEKELDEHPLRIKSEKWGKIAKTYADSARTGYCNAFDPKKIKLFYGRHELKSFFKVSFRSQCQYVGSTDYFSYTLYNVLEKNSGSLTSLLGFEGRESCSGGHGSRHTLSVFEPKDVGLSKQIISDLEKRSKINDDLFRSAIRLYDYSLKINFILFEANLESNSFKNIIYNS